MFVFLGTFFSLSLQAVKFTALQLQTEHLWSCTFCPPCTCFHTNIMCVMYHRHLFNLKIGGLDWEERWILFEIICYVYWDCVNYFFYSSHVFQTCLYLLALNLLFVMWCIGMFSAKRKLFISQNPFFWRSLLKHQARDSSWILTLWQTLAYSP